MHFSNVSVHLLTSCSYIPPIIYVQIASPVEPSAADTGGSQIFLYRSVTVHHLYLLAASYSMRGPVDKHDGYEYLDHPADIQIHAWGATLRESFERTVIAMFGWGRHFRPRPLPAH